MRGSSSFKVRGTVDLDTSMPTLGVVGCPPVSDAAPHSIDFFLELQRAWLRHLAEPWRVLLLRLCGAFHLRLRNSFPQVLGPRLPSCGPAVASPAASRSSVHCGTGRGGPR